MDKLLLDTIVSREKSRRKESLERGEELSREKSRSKESGGEATTVEHPAAALDLESKEEQVP